MDSCTDSMTILKDLTYSLYRNGGDLLWVLNGKLTVQNCELMLRRLAGPEDGSVERCLLEVSGLRHVDSAGLGLIVTLTMQLRKRGISVGIVAPTPSLMKLLELSRVAMLVPVVRGIQVEEVRRRLYGEQWLVEQSNPSSEEQPR